MQSCSPSDAQSPHLGATGLGCVCVHGFTVAPSWS
jgi:hypothetical protein